MKKFLSILGVSVLSLSLLVGCGGASKEDAEAAAQKMTSSAMAIAQNMDKLDSDSQKELADLQAEAQEFASSATTLTEDSDYTEIIEKMTALDQKFRDIADKNGIEIKELDINDLK